LFIRFGLLPSILPALFDVWVVDSGGQKEACVRLYREHIGDVRRRRDLLSNNFSLVYYKGKKGKGFPYSIPSVGPGADPGVKAVSLHATASHPPGGRLPLLSARPAVTSPAAEHHRPLAGTKLYCLTTEAHRCKQLA